MTFLQKHAVVHSAHSACSNAINATLNAQGDATVDTPQFLATLLTSHFDVTCSPVARTKRLGKRGLTDDDRGCIALSAFSLAVFAASNIQVQDALSSVPLNFDVKGGLIDVKTKVGVMIQQNPSRFTARIFSPQSIQSIIAYFTTLAAYVWENGPGTEITHIVLTLSQTEIEPTRSCSSWTFSWTSPTVSKTTVVSSSSLMTFFGSEILLAG